MLHEPEERPDDAAALIAEPRRDDAGMQRIGGNARTLEAARQLSHGDFNPHWAFSPAFNAGEPRFVFYPPLSWRLVAALGLLLGITQFAFLFHKIGKLKKVFAAGSIALSVIYIFRTGSRGCMTG